MNGTKKLARDVAANAALYLGSGLITYQGFKTGGTDTPLGWDMVQVGAAGFVISGGYSLKIAKDFLGGKYMFDQETD